MLNRRCFMLAGAALIAGVAPAAEPVGRFEALPFSNLVPGAALPDWLRHYGFAGRERHTEYALVVDDSRTVLRARSDNATLGLVRTVAIDPNRLSRLAWRWKVNNLIRGSDAATRAGDDFPVRLYLTFDVALDALSLGDRMKIALARSIWGEEVPAAALCYVWDRRLPVGAIVPNAYTDRVRMVVAESGAARLGRWLAFERDVAADFRRAFAGEETANARRPVPRVTSVIVSTDTDDTGETVEAFYGDVVFSAAGTANRG